MYARIVFVKTHQGRLEAAAASFRDTVLPALTQQAGFVQAHLWLDEPASSAVTMTVWSSRESLSASDASGLFTAHVAQVRDLLAQPPQVSTLRLAAQAGGPWVIPATPATAPAA